MQVQLLLRHGSHRHEIWINNRYLHHSVEAIYPEVTLLRRWTEEHEAASVRLQLEAIVPRRLFPVDISDSFDPLNADNFTPTKISSN